MSQPAARTFTSDFKRFFVRGLVVLLPSVLTLWIVVKAYQFVDSTIAEPINGYVRLAIAEAAAHWEPLRTRFDPSKADIQSAAAAAGLKPPSEDALRVQLRHENVNTWWAKRWYMDLIGLAVAIVGVYIAGRLLGGFVGRQVYRKFERVFTSLPLFRQVYPYVKQVVDFLFSDDKTVKFSRVVVFEYPRKGIWSIGFQTGPGLRTVEQAPGDCVTIFVPSSPTPFTGYTITLPRSDVLELPITVEEAIRFVVSGGVLVPAGEQSPPAAVLEAAQPSGAVKRLARSEAASPQSSVPRPAIGPTVLPPPEPAS